MLKCLLKSGVVVLNGNSIFSSSNITRMNFYSDGQYIRNDSSKTRNFYLVKLGLWCRIQSVSGEITCTCENGWNGPFITVKSTWFMV